MRTPLRLFPVCLLSLSAFILSAAAQQKPELYLQTTHTGGVYRLAFGTDDRALITGGGQSTVKVWDVLTGRDVRTFAAEEYDRSALSLDGKLLASLVGNSGEAETIELRETATGRELRTIKSAHGELDHLALSPNNELLAAIHTSYEREQPSQVVLWRVADGSELHTLNVRDGNLVAISFSPDSSRLMVSGYTPHGPPEMKMTFWAALWDVASGRELYRVLDSSSSVFSPDGATLAGLEGNVIKLWRAADGSPLHVLKDPAAEQVRPVVSIVEVAEGSAAERAGLQSGDKLAGIDDRTFQTPAEYLSYLATRKAYVFKVIRERRKKIVTRDSLEDFASGQEEKIIRFEKPAAGLGFKLVSYMPRYDVSQIGFSPDGKTLASAGSDEIVKFWDVETGALVRSLAGPSGEVRSLAFSPDSRLLATGSQQGDVLLWDALSGQFLRRLIEPQADASYISTIAFSHDGRSVAAGWGWPGTDSSFGVWDVATGKPFELFRARSDFIGTVNFTRDGNILVANESGADTNRVRLWNTQTGTLLPSILGKQKSFAVSPDSKLLVTADDANELKFWDIRTGALVHTFEAHTEVGGLAFSQDGRILLSRNGGVSGDGLIKMWDAASGAALRTSIKGDFSLAWEAVFSPNGRILALPYATYAELWSTVTGSKLATIEGHDMTGGDAVLTAAFSPDSRLLATAGTLVDGKIKLWNATTGKLLRTLTTKAGETSELLFSPDGKTLASAGDNVQLWDVASGQLLYAVEGGSASFSRDGQILATSAGRKLKLWDRASGAELASLVAINDNDWVVVTPDGLFDGSPEGWKSILWRFSESLYDVAPVEIFFNEFYYPNLLADLLAGKRPRARQDISQLDRRQPRLHLSLVGEHALDQPIGERRITVKIEVRDAGAGAEDVRLFRNGSLVKVWSGALEFNSEGRAELTTSLPIVAGENLLTAYGFNRYNIKSADALLKLTGAPGLKRQGTAYVMAVGINAYDNPDFALRYAVADAQAFAAEISAQQKRLGRYERTEVIALYDGQATRAAILKALSDLAARTEPEDAVVIYFAGHGTAQASQFYLIPHDLGYMGSRTEVTSEGLRTLLAHSISDRDLQTAFERIDAEQLLLVIDACNSGQALEAEEKRRGPMNSKGLAQLAYEKGMSILTAAQGYQEALENEYLGHGYLTYALIEDGLKRLRADIAPKDGRVTEREWLDYATQRVPQMQEEQENPQSRKGRGRRGITTSPNVQRPRVFYRRETEAQPLIVAQSAQAAPARK